MSACVEYSVGAAPPWGIPRHGNPLSLVDQAQHESEDWPVSHGPTSLTAPLHSGRSVRLLQSLLQSLRSTLEISRLPIGVAQSASKVLDAVEERQRCSVMQSTADVEVLSAVLAQLRLVLAADCACGTASTAASVTTDEVVQTTDDPWADFEDIATEDLFEWYAQALQAGCREALSADVDDCQRFSDVSYSFMPASSARSYSSSHFAPMKSPRWQSIGSASTLSSLDFGGSERLSTTSTLSSVQASLRPFSSASPISSARISVTSSSRTSVEPSDAELCHPGRESESMWQRLRRLSAPPVPSSGSHEHDARLHCEQRLDVAAFLEPPGTISSGSALRHSDLEPETTRRKKSGMTWQQMWKRKLESSSRLQDAES